MALGEGSGPVRFQFISETHGYAVNGTGRLFETTDSGKTWLQTTPVSEESRLSFVGASADARTLWLASRDTVWYREGDTGRWAVLPPPPEKLLTPAPPATGPAHRLPSPTARHLRFATGLPSPRATMGGLDAKHGIDAPFRQYSPIPETSRIERRNSPVSPAAEPNAPRWSIEGLLALHDGHEAVIFASGRAFHALTDGSPASLESLPESDHRLRPTLGHDQESLWILHPNGDVTLRDATGQWHDITVLLPRLSELPRTLPDTLALQQVLPIADNAEGWAAGDRDLWHTTDGGASWRRALTLALDLTAPDVSPDRTEINVGASTGVILHSSDGGRSFSPHALPGRPPVHWVATDWSRGQILAGTAAGLYRTADGRSWQLDLPGDFTWAAIGEDGAGWIALKPNVGSVRVYRITGWQPMAGPMAPPWGDTLPPNGTGWIAWTSAASSWQPLADPTAPPWGKTPDQAPLTRRAVGIDFSHLTCPGVDLLQVVAASDHRHAWVAGAGGTFLSTSNAGQTWSALERSQSLAPWYLTSWVLVALFVGVGLKPARVSRDYDPTIAGLLVSDRPLTHAREDALGLDHLARGIERFIRNEQTKPPVTFAIRGDWGTGKSSVLGLLSARLKGSRSKVVSFNAWHHEQDDNLLAAMYTAIIEQGVPRITRGDLSLFRVHLLWLRTRRYWISLVVGSCLLLPTLGYFYADRERVNNVVHRLDDLRSAIERLGDTSPEQPPHPEVAPPWFALSSGLAGLFALGSATLRAGQAFGVDPAHLVSSLGSTLKLPEQRERVSFESRFARDFREVIEALKPWRMVILIDDLDRCSPKNVLKMLDAINFLVSSGDCFVVVALAPTVINTFVGMELKDVALAVEQGEDEAEKRLRHARHYLQKIFNIEIDIPPLDQQGTARLITRASPKALPTPGRDTDESSWSRQVVLAGFSLIAAFSLFMLGLNSFPPARSTTRPRQQDAVLAAQVGAVAMAAGSQPAVAKLIAEPTLEMSGRQSGSLSAPPPTSSARATDYQFGIPSEPRPPRWPYVLLALLATIALSARAIQLPKGPVEDSPDFTRALEIWHAVILQSCPTPRAIKRFLNRVRFLAMSQHQTRVSPFRQPA